MMSVANFGICFPVTVRMFFPVMMVVVALESRGFRFRGIEFGSGIFWF
jgi:hypothetical protein